MKDIKVIGFDADDTLWICEPIFRNAEEVIAGLLTEWFDSETLKKEILKNHVSNIPLYGYGIKGYILSIIETVMDLGEDKVPPSKLQEIIKIGKGMLNEPITIINDVDSILPILKEKYRLVVATKGDRLDQQRKLNEIGRAHV